MKEKKYHISRTGSVRVCDATEKECPRGGLDKHYSTPEEAYKAIAEDNKGNLLKPLKKMPGSKKITDNGKFWDSSLDVRSVAKKLPHQYPDNNIKKSEEVFVNGESIGYYVEFTEEGYDPNNTRYGYLTHEQANTKLLPLRGGCYSKKNAVAELMKKEKYSHVEDILECEEVTNNYSRSNPEIISIDRETSIFQETSAPSKYSPNKTNHHCFLVKNGKPVSFIKYSYDKDYGIVLCDAETRESERGHGYAKELVKIIKEQHDNAKIYGTGSFTEDGLKAFGDIIEKQPGSNNRDWGASVDPMVFIENWDTMESRFHL